MSILKAFNDHLGEFIGELIKLFPTDIDLKASHKVFLGLRKINPKSLIVNWKYYVTDKYKAEIYQGNINFFLEKSYEDDLTDVEDRGTAKVAIERLRGPLSKIGSDNLEKAIKYLKNLTKLSELYFNT